MINVPWHIWNKPFTPITKEEYYEWLKDSVVVEPDHFTSTAFQGYHESATTILKNGMYYDMIYWFDYVKGGMDEGYGIKELCAAPNQGGEGI